MPKHTRPVRIPRLQWLCLLLLTAAMASGSLFSTGCALVDTSSNTPAPSATVTPTPTPTPTPIITPTPSPTATPTPTPTPTPNIFTGPQQSSAIAISNDSRALVAVNPETNTVSVFDASTDAMTKLREVTTGIDPRSVAVMPNGLKAYIACAGGASGTTPGVVTVLTLATGVTANVTVGIEPQSVVISPNATLVYVGNAVSNTISVIDTVTDAVTQTLVLPVTGASQPRALAITNDNDAVDTDETLYVAQFFAARRAGKTGLDEGQDDQREGHVLRVACTTPATVNPTPIALGPLGGGLAGPPNSGFASNGSVLDFVGTTNGVTSSVGATDAPDPVNPNNFALFQTGCFPNQLAAIAIHPIASTNPRAYVASTAASPNGPFRFNVNVQGLVSMFNTSSNIEDRQGQPAANTLTIQEAPLNMNKGIGRTVAATRLFNSNPTAMAWRPPLGNEAWIAIQTTDQVIRMNVDAAGIPTISSPLAGTNQPPIPQVDLEPGNLPGRAPFGLVFNTTGTRLFVNNFVSRSISVVNPATLSRVTAVQSAALPVPGSLEDTVQLGARLFFSGREAGALSSEGWGACIACHPDGRTDGVTWMFAAGPRQVVPLDGMFSKKSSGDQRILNWSAIVDENQDFENNSRGISGGRGLIADDRQVIMVGGFDATGVGETLGSLSELTAPVSATAPLATANTTNSLVGGQALPAIAPRLLFGSATLPDGRIYIGGGLDAGGADVNTIIEIDPSTNTTRTRTATLTVARHGLGAAAVNTVLGPRIYFFGGFTTNTSPSAVVEEYNPATNTLRLVTPMQFPLGDFGSSPVPANNTGTPQDLIWVVGGNPRDEFDTLSVTSTIYRFTPDPVVPGTGGTWLNFNGILPNGGRRRLAVGAIIRLVANNLFAIGGLDATDNITSAVTEINIANPAAPATVATTITQLPNGRSDAAVSVSQNQIFLLGGTDDTGNTTSTVLQFNPGANGPQPGPLFRPSGSTWAHVLNLPRPTAFGGANIPLPVNNFTPVGNALREPRQDAIAEWIKFKVRAQTAPNRGATGTLATSISNGRTHFLTSQLDGTNGVAGISCATCHGGNKWTRSTVSYTPPPSVSTAFGTEEIIGAELRRTTAQPGDAPQTGVLVNVGTFFAPTFNTFSAGGVAANGFGGVIGNQSLFGGAQNEVRFNLGDVADRIVALGGQGFNIPSLLSVASTAPYFHSGRAQTLDEVLNGSADGQGASTLRNIHNVSNVSATVRTELIDFLRSIDDTTTPAP